jgi:gas vesicle protein
MTTQKDSKMGLGLFFGMIIGALGGIFLAPKSGKENREIVSKRVGEMKGMIESGEMRGKIEEVFGNLSDESVKMYTNVRNGIMDHIEEMKNMSGDDYGKMVQNVIDKLREGSKMGADQAMKLKDHFMKEGPEMKEEAEKKTKRTKEKLIAQKD